MKNLPGIDFWWDKIDDRALSAHAVRRWQEPSNGVFMLVAIPSCGYVSYREREQIQTELERRLRNREHQLAAWYGRHWRHHLTDRIDSDGTPLGTPC